MNDTHGMIFMRTCFPNAYRCKDTDEKWLLNFSVFQCYFRELTVVTN